MKILIIVGIIAYILYKVGSFLFKIGAASQQFRDHKSGNIPGEGGAKKKKPNISGEYIDYEEVK